MIHYNPQPHARIISNIQSVDDDVDVENKKILYSLDEAGKNEVHLGA